MVSENFLRIVDSLGIEEASDLKKSIYQRLEDKNTNLEMKFQDKFYKTLSILLKSKKFEDFKRLRDASDKLDIFIDVSKIPNRFEIISKIHLNGIQTGQIEELFDVIRFFNENNLFNWEFSEEDIKFIDTIKKDKLIIANLRDLFGRVNDFLILFVYKLLILQIVMHLLCRLYHN